MWGMGVILGLSTPSPLPALWSVKSTIFIGYSGPVLLERKKFTPSQIPRKPRVKITIKIQLVSRQNDPSK